MLLMLAVVHVTGARMKTLQQDGTCDSVAVLRVLCHFSCAVRHYRLDAIDSTRGSEAPCRDAGRLRRPVIGPVDVSLVAVGPLAAKRVLVDMAHGTRTASMLPPTTSGSPRKRTAMAIAFAWAMATSIVSPVHTQQRFCSFPGVKARCTAPKGDADIEWREQNGSRPHQLFLRTGSAAKPVLIHEFGRSVDLL
jgi:hypothetical protein